MSKRILSLVLALVMVLGTFGTVFAAEPTENERVNKLIELGLVKGDGTGYRLNDTIRRDEVAAMVVRSMDLESVALAMQNVPTKFVDVKAGEWNNGYVAVAEGRGITKGTSANTFSPARPITYSEVAAMLVRVLNGLTADEEKVAVWPATYIAKAHELGILADVAIANMNEMATREKVFEMVYNTINNKNANLLVASTVEGIVVENYRTENLAKDEIVVHVMKDQVQRTDSKYYEEGDEVRIVINADLKKAGHDVETLLGKVVTVSFDKDEKVVDIKVNNNYTYLQGALTEANSKELELEGKWYTVGKAEARTAVDERLYQVYFNNEDVHYSADLKSDDFLDLIEDYDEAEFARITVRNGKVLFIDAFAFEDIAPVAKEIDAKDRVSYYDDSKDGAINTLVVDEDAYVVNFVDGKMTLGNYKDIDTNDVIHYFEGDKDVLTVFVRPSDDNKVEGEYKEANAARAKDAADIKILVDKTEYKADIKTENRNPVYSVVASDYEFYRLTEDYDDELADFEKEEVVVLRDMFGKVQLISTEKIDGRFYAVISDLYNYDFKLVKTDNTNTWFDTDRDTVLSGTGTREQRINNFDKNDLVLASAKEELLTKLELVEADFGPATIEKITKDVVDFGSRYYYVGKRTVLFDITGKTPKGMTVADFIKNYDLDKTVKGYVVENGKDAKLVDVIVITEATAKDNAKYEELIVKVTRVRVSGTTYRLTVVDAAGETATYYVDEDIAEELLLNNKVVSGSIVEITVPKEADKDGNKEIKEMTEIIDEKQPVFKVLEVGRDRARNENYMVLADGSNPVVKKTVWVSRIADVFGDYKVGSYVSIEGIDKYNTTFVVDVRSDKYDMAIWDEAETPDPVDPVDPVEITAEATVASLAGQSAIKITLSDNAELANVKEVKVNGTVASHTVVDTEIRVMVTGVVTTVEVVMNNDAVVTAVIK